MIGFLVTGLQAIVGREITVGFGPVPGRCFFDGVRDWRVVVMRMLRCFLLGGVLVLPPALASAKCRQALALGLDVSGSVDAAEFRLQLDGLAGALADPDVQNAFFAMPTAPVDLAVFLWSAPNYQPLIVDWTSVTGPDVLSRIAGQLHGTRRHAAPPGTALGAAMETGAALLERRTDCWSRTLDLSGDGKHNVGPHPKSVRPVVANLGITLNALVIGADAPQIGDIRQTEISELSSYFQAYVITGPDAFVQTALGFEDYENAMIRKLTRELEGLVVSGNVPPDVNPSPPQEMMPISGPPRSATWNTKIWTAPPDPSNSSN
ncbi:MAG: DUF1194 domain-containing protein [Pseudomonadota bacterium]